MGAAVGLAWDEALGEPPLAPHPVALFGRFMRGAERHLYADGRTRGVVHAAVGVATGAVAGVVVGSTAAGAYVAIAGRGLREAGEEVARPALVHDLDGARAALPALVGRDPSELDAKEIARAAVESMAENTVDAIVAPALWAVVAGAPGALAYRAVNTMDAMVGHRSPRYGRYGWAAARLDDWANWVPARVTAALVAGVRPRDAASVWRAVRDQAPAHPSPNSGVAEAAFAAALGLRLGGVNRYGERVEVRPELGTGRPPEPADIAAAARLSRDVGRLLAAVLVVVAAGVTRP